MADKAFIKGLRLLTALAESDEPRALTGLARQLGLTKSNTHRLLSTLIDQGFAVQEGEKGLYRPTLRLWELGAGIVGRLEVVTVARPHMAQLAAATGETVHLSALEGAEVVYLDKIEGTQAVRSYTRVGARAPAWCVATGKILLAHRSAAERAALYPKLAAWTPLTLSDPQRLERELAQARAAGVAFNRGEWRADVVGAAAPVFDAGGAVVAAVGISGPAMRLAGAALDAQAAAVIAAGQAIGEALGYRGGAAPAPLPLPAPCQADISSKQSSARVE